MAKVDLCFPILGGQIPADHGYLLYLRRSADAAEELSHREHGGHRDLLYSAVSWNLRETHQGKNSGNAVAAGAFSRRTNENHV